MTYRAEELEQSIEQPGTKISERKPISSSSAENNVGVSLKVRMHSHKRHELGDKMHGWETRIARQGARVHRPEPGFSGATTLRTAWGTGRRAHF
jgi:hypothetical protein